MEDKKTCVRCDRQIDPYARICPYCNWDQTNPAPPPSAQPAVAQTPAYVPPQERNWRKHLLMAGGGIAVLILAFVVGAFINSDDTPKNAPKPVTDEIGVDEGIARTRRADVTLVPVDEANPFETPITSAPTAAPAEGVPAEYQRSDATAVSSVEYAALAQRAQAERQAKQMIDPRSLTGPAYAPAPRRAPRPEQPVPPPMTSAAEEPLTAREERPSEPVEPRIKITKRTRPVPEHQPLPRISVTQPVTARLELTVGADGRVKAVRLKNGIPGNTPALIAAVQSWRFKPATENGVPVSAPFSVDISFNP
ncbi:MAG: energy transducer TonB [Thermoanaerobaculia bacterium]